MKINQTSLAFIQSFSEAGRTAPDNTAFIESSVVKGLCDGVLKATSSQEDAALRAANFVESHRLDLPTLSADIFRGLVQPKNLREAVFAVVQEAEAKGSANEQLESRFNELMTATPNNLRGLARDRATARRSDTGREFRSRADLFINQSLDLMGGMAFVEAVGNIANSVASEAQEHFDTQSGKQRISVALELLREARNVKWFSHDSRVKQATEALATALIGWAQLVAQEEARKEVLGIYNMLEEVAAELKLNIEALRQRFLEVQGQATATLNTPFPFRGELTDPTEEPLMSRQESLALAEEALGFRPNDPGPEQIGRLASHLAGLPSQFQSSMEGLAEGIASSFRPLLEDVFPVSVENALDILARQDTLTAHEVGQGILDGLLRDLGYSWLQVNEVELSDELADRPPILRLAVPNQSVLERFFGEITWAGQTRVVPGLKKITLVRIDGGIHKEAIQQWPTLETAMEEANRDGHGVVIPKMLTRKSGKRSPKPDDESDAAEDFTSFDESGPHRSPVEENGQNPQTAGVE